MKPQEPKPTPTDKWPELEPVRPALTPEQALALEKVRLRAENANTLLVKRSRVLLVAVAVGLVSVVINALQVVPALLRGQSSEPTFLTALSMLLQLCAAIYFLRAKDPVTASQILRLLLILNGLILVLGLALLGLPVFTTITLILMFAAYRHMEQLKSSDR